MAEYCDDNEARQLEQPGQRTQMGLSQQNTTYHKSSRLFRGAIVRIPRARPPPPSREHDEQSEPEIATEEECIVAAATDRKRRWVTQAVTFLNPSELRRSRTLWKAALVESVGSAALTFASSCSVITSVNSTLTYPPLAIAVMTGIILSLIIYATAASSGGHVNPLITMSTCVTGLTSPMRTLLYVPSQMIGSAIGSFFFRSGMGAWGEETTALEMAGCVVGEEMTLAQAFCLEFASSFFVLIVAFGCALDPNASRVYGPIWAPLLIGVVVGSVVLVTSALGFPGYTGVGVNPARCFGPSLIAWDEWEAYWRVYLLAPMVAAVSHAPIYLCAPSYPPGKKQKRSSTTGI